MIILFATNNEHKVKEIQALLPCERYRVISLKDIHFNASLREEGDDLLQNARSKAQQVYDFLVKNGTLLSVDAVLSDDTGLFVDALNGAPGVHTARYAGEHCTDKENRSKLLQNMCGKADRAAYFQTVLHIIFLPTGQHAQCIGEARGTITEEEKGDSGFGYDSIFLPDGSQKTFAQMTNEQKNAVSHRKKAAEKLLTLLDARLEKK